MNYESTDEYTLIERDNDIVLQLTMDNQYITFYWTTDIKVSEYFAKLIAINDTNIWFNNDTVHDMISVTPTFTFEYDKNGKHYIHTVGGRVVQRKVGDPEIGYDVIKDEITLRAAYWEDMVGYNAKVYATIKLKKFIETE